MYVSRFPFGARVLSLALLVAGVAVACAPANHSVPTVAALRAASAQPHFVAEPFPSGFIPYAIMKDGRVTGSFGNDAAFYLAGRLTDLGSYRGEPTHATSANAAGAVVGYSQPPNPNVETALLFRDGKIIDLGQAPGQPQAIPVAISDRGDIYGSADDSQKQDAPYVARYRPGTPQLLQPNTALPVGSIANSASNGVFAYTYWDFGADVHHAYRCSDLCHGDKQLFPGYWWSTANWINDAETVVGTVIRRSYQQTGPMRAYQYPLNGPPMYLPLASGINSMVPAGINNSGQIVGNESGRTVCASSCVFFYSGGELYNVTKNINPSGTYQVLPGLSDGGEFIGCLQADCFLIKPQV